MYYITYSIDTIEDLVSGIAINHIESEKIILLKGDMGVGKTTFTKNLVKYLGYNGLVNSPTFSYYNEYIIEHSNILIRHFDLYRIENINEFKNKGFEELIIPEKNCIIIIEWPEKINDVIKKFNNTIELHFIYNNDDPNKRTIEIN